MFADEPAVVFRLEPSVQLPAYDRRVAGRLQRAWAQADFEHLPFDVLEAFLPIGYELHCLGGHPKPASWGHFKTGQLKP
jgi:hypothetical protein